MAQGDYLYEPKWDGFRSISWSKPENRIDSRNQRPLLRYFPELTPLSISCRPAPSSTARSWSSSKV